MLLFLEGYDYGTFCAMYGFCSGFLFVVLSSGPISSEKSSAFMQQWGLILLAILTNRGSANWSKMDQFENLSKIYLNSCILSPILWAVFGHIGGLPIGPELSNF